MEKIIDILKKKKFTISVEFIPPRNGTSYDELYEQLNKLMGKVDFISVTKGAGGSLRGGTLPLSYFAQNKFGINTLAHFVCREHTKFEIENELMDLHNFGIRNILALRGDPPACHKESWDGDYRYAYLLVKQINDMNKGIYLPRINVDESSRTGLKTDFCIVAAGHPEDPIDEEIEHVKAKIKAGAEVIITQMIFSFEEYKEYVESLRKNGIDVPIIPGIRPLTNFKSLESLEDFFKLSVNKDLKKNLKNAKTEKEAYEVGMQYFTEMIKKIRNYGAPSMHLYVLNDIGLVEELLARSGFK